METPVLPAPYLGDRVVWAPGHLCVVDDELLGRVARPYLSPSMAKAMSSCPETGS